MEMYCKYGSGYARSLKELMKQIVSAILKVKNSPEINVLSFLRDKLRC